MKLKKTQISVFNKILFAMQMSALNRLNPKGLSLSSTVYGFFFIYVFFFVCFCFVLFCFVFLFQRKSQSVQEFRQPPLSL